MIIKKEQKGGITILYVHADTESVEKLLGNSIKKSRIPHIVEEDTDVYDNDTHQLLLRFRKSLIPLEVCDQFYDAVAQHARLKTANRLTFQGAKSNGKKHASKYIMTNIFGFMDGWSASQKRVFTQSGRAILQPDIRPTQFNMKSPEKYEQTLPFIRKINDEYRALVPDRFKLQDKKAKQIRGFTIGDTAFTTVTLNLNHVSQLHVDKGDDEEGFGNLTVVEHGSGYTGGETCFPRYGLGVNVRTGDILFMNVHEPHCNLPIQYAGKDSERLSVVCYLRKNIWIKGKGMTVKKRVMHNATIKKRFT